MPENSRPVEQDPNTPREPAPSPARWGASRSFLVSVAIAAAAFGSAAFGQAPKGGADPLGEVLAQSEPEDGSELVSMRVLLTPRVMFPDYPAVVAVVFDIEPGWHVYWKNSGDTGMPIRLSFDLPEGLRAGNVYWPGPKRYPMPGDLLDFIYEDQVVLFVPIHGEGGPRESLDIGVKAEWLVCKEACLPGEAEVRTAITAGSTIAAADERMLDRHLSRLPLPLFSRASVSWEGTTMVVDCKGALGMVFFPEYDRKAMPLNILRDGEVAGEQLRIPFGDAVREAGRVRGVLEIRNNIGRSAFYEVDIAPPR